MRTADMTLITALAARTPLWSADLFTISLLDGTVYRWTSADQSIVWSGNVYSAIGPAIQRSSWSAKNTTEVPELEIQLYSTGSDLAAGNIKTLLHNGFLDGAAIELRRAFMPTFGDTSFGAVLLFTGRAGKVAIDSLGAKITATASNVLLTQYVPRNTYQTGCIHTLYDAGCTLNRADFSLGFTVLNANSLIVNIDGTAMPDATIYLLGTLEMTSGAGVGQVRTVNAVSSTSFGVSYPFYSVPQPGDTFTVTQGCNKTVSRCAVFNNTANYRGFPFIPPAEYGV